MQIDRPIDELLASAMPPNRPSGGGDGGPGPESAEPESEREDEQDDKEGGNPS